MVPDDFIAGTYVHTVYTQVNWIIDYNNHTVGQPVGCCITDKENYDVIKLFLEMTKSKSPDSQMSVIMTDYGKLINAYSI